MSALICGVSDEEDEMKIEDQVPKIENVHIFCEK